MQESTHLPWFNSSKDSEGMPKYLAWLRLLTEETTDACIINVEINLSKKQLHKVYNVPCEE